MMIVGWGNEGEDGKGGEEKRWEEMMMIIMIITTITMFSAYWLSGPTYTYA